MFLVIIFFSITLNVHNCSTRYSIRKTFTIKGTHMALTCYSLYAFYIHKTPCLRPLAPNGNQYRLEEALIMLLISYL